MTLLLNGTNGVSDVDGSASTPAVRGTDANTGIFFPAADTIAFAEGGAEVARFDSSGNLGLGATSITPRDSGARVLEIYGGTGGRSSIKMTNSTSGTGATDGMFIGYDDNLDCNILNTESGNLRFGTSNTNRMTIDSSGRIGVNSAPAAWIGNEQFYVAGTSSLTNQFVGNIAVGSSSPSGACSLFLNYASAAPNNTSNSYLICNDNSGVQKLNIYSNGTVSNRTGTYNSLSDAKLKENIADATPKLDKLMQVKVRNYNLIGDELKQIGFVAQELEQIFPSLVDNVPDFDENNEPTGEVTKGVKLTVMIPILVKAIQEQQAIITDLKSRIEALEQA